MIHNKKDLRMPFHLGSLKDIFSTLGVKLSNLKDGIVETLSTIAEAEYDIVKEVKSIQLRIDNSPFRGYLTLVYVPEQAWFAPIVELRYVTGSWRFRNRVKNFPHIYDEIFERVDELSKVIEQSRKTRRYYSKEN